MTKRKQAKRRNACPICGQQRRQPGLPLTVPFGIPTYWSPGEALAIFEFIDEMRDIIAVIYGPHITIAARQQYQAPQADRLIIPDDELPF